jgi:hypothetical protein
MVTRKQATYCAVMFFRPGGAKIIMRVKTKFIEKMTLRTEGVNLKAIKKRAKKTYL